MNSDAVNGLKLVLGAAGTLYLVRQLGKDIEVEGQHWIMLIVIFLAGYVTHALWPKPGQMVGLP